MRCASGSRRCWTGWRGLATADALVDDRPRRLVRPTRSGRPTLTPEDLLAAHSPPIVELAQRLRALVRRTVPDAEERAYPVWRGVGYVHPTAGYVCAFFPFREYVALAFEYGVLLPDPAGLLRPGRTSSRKVRYVEVRTAKDIRARPIQALLRQAVALRSERADVVQLGRRARRRSGRRRGKRR